MSNFVHSRQEHPEEQDPGIEIVDLEPSESMSTLDKLKRDLLARVEKKHLARPFLVKQGKVQLAALWGVVLVGLIVVLSASGMFSFLLSHFNHPSAPPSLDVLLLVRNTLRCLVDTAVWQETTGDANFYPRVMMCEWLILPFRDMKSNAPTMAKCRKQ